MNSGRNYQQLLPEGIRIYVVGFTPNRTSVVKYGLYTFRQNRHSL